MALFVGGVEIGSSPLLVGNDLIVQAYLGSEKVYDINEA